MWCRYALLAGAAFCDGFVVGPLVDMAVGLNPAMVLTAFLATASIFACFSGAGMTALSSLNITLLEATYPKANATACVHALSSHQYHIHVRRPFSDCTSACSVGLWWQRQRGGVQLWWQGAGAGCSQEACCASVTSIVTATYPPSRCINPILSSTTGELESFCGMQQ